MDDVHTSECDIQDPKLAISLTIFSHTSSFSRLTLQDAALKTRGRKSPSLGGNHPEEKRGGGVR